MFILRSNSSAAGLLILRSLNLNLNLNFNLNLNLHLHFHSCFNLNLMSQEKRCNRESQKAENHMLNYYSKWCCYRFKMLLNPLFRERSMPSISFSAAWRSRCAPITSSCRRMRGCVCVCKGVHGCVQAMMNAYGCVCVCRMFGIVLRYA